MISMLEPIVLPDLDFPSMKYGARETPLDFKVLLFQGGAKTRIRRVGGMLAAGRLGDVKVERLPLVVKMHEIVFDKLVSGGSQSVVQNVFRSIRTFFAWAEASNYALTLDSIQSIYMEWTASLNRRVSGECPAKERMTRSSAYTQGAIVGQVLDEMLERITPLVGLSRLKTPLTRKGSLGIAAEKQILSSTMDFGHMLQDICDSLTIDVVLNAPLPISIPLRSGKTILQETLGYKTAIREKNKRVARWTGSVVPAEILKLNWNDDHSLSSRFSIANLRCEAEFLIFIGQTGFNFAQAHRLRLDQFCYISYLDGYHVKSRKERRGGDVVFEIFKEYRSHFERYLDWRRVLFPDSSLLFPFARSFDCAQDRPTQFHRTREACQMAGLEFVGPRKLRGVRVNWMLRQSGNPDLTADAAQHTKETLYRYYARPSQQRAIAEIMRFWSAQDVAEVKKMPVAPGECNGVPKGSSSIPSGMTGPDCIRASGCLWCDSHRDIDSQDYIWALVSFRHLKSIELAKTPPKQNEKHDHPASLALGRILAKLQWFGDSSSVRRSWVEEAEARIEEGSYHPRWERIINRAEGKFYDNP